MYRDPVQSLEAPSLQSPTAAMRPLRVGMIGIGTVGAGTFRVLARNQALIAGRAGRDIKLVVVCARSLARAMSVVASRRQIEATEAFSRGDNARAQALIQQNQVSLGQAAAAAPAAMRPKLEAQVNTYESDSKAFATGGSGARDATKKAMARELGNTGRAATY